MARKPILYISYDGMLEPLGQSQVIAYLEGLSDSYAFHLLSFEKPKDRADKPRVAALKARLKAAGIAWAPLTYHKSPSVPATLFDIAQGLVAAFYLVVRRRIRLVHARSYLPALVGWALKAICGVRLLFDMRGLWADERVDGGLWPAGGRVYRVVKALERHLLLSADAVVTLTHASAREIEGFAYLADRKLALDVIPTCADLDRFRPPPTGNGEGPFTLGYLGSVGTWYLFDEILRCFRLICAQRPDAQMLVVNRHEQDFIRKRAGEFGIGSDRLSIVSVEHRDVPQQIARMTVGAAIIKPTYSKIASAPTKLAEYLGCGVPCLGNVGVGDMREILEGEGTGVAIEGFSDAELQSGVNRLFALLADAATPARCRAVAERLFSLGEGVAAYRRIYARLV